MSDDGPTTFVGSDGEYYAAREVCRRLAADEWGFCMRSREDGRELYETAGGDLLLLVPTDAVDFGEGWRARTVRR
jgi:hypothetical protein